MTVPKDIQPPLGATGTVSPAECATMNPRDPSGWRYGNKRKGGDYSSRCGVIIFVIVVKRGLAGEKAKDGTSLHSAIVPLYVGILRFTVK